jgi:rhodanese-related sulfurtransferase
MQINPIELAARRDIAIIDVRDGRERELTGNIPGAFLCPAQTLNREALERVVALDQPIALACMSGRRTAFAVAIAKDAGYTHILELSGGLAAWVRAGLPICAGYAPSAASTPDQFTQFPRTLVACFVAEVVQDHNSNTSASLDALHARVLRYIDEEYAANKGNAAAAMHAVIDRTAMLARALGFPLETIRRNVDHMRSQISPHPGASVDAGE